MAPSAKAPSHSSPQTLAFPLRLVRHFAASFSASHHPSLPKLQPSVACRLNSQCRYPWYLVTDSCDLLAWSRSCHRAWMLGYAGPDDGSHAMGCLVREQILLGQLGLLVRGASIICLKIFYLSVQRCDIKVSGRRLSVGQPSE
jgi:hypothetical protein